MQRHDRHKRTISTYSYQWNEGFTIWLWSKICTQHGTLASGNMDQNLRSPGGLILTHTHICYQLALPTISSFRLASWHRELPCPRLTTEQGCLFILLSRVFGVCTAQSVGLSCLDSANAMFKSSSKTRHPNQMPTKFALKRGQNQSQTSVSASAGTKLRLASLNPKRSPTSKFASDMMLTPD